MQYTSVGISLDHKYAIIHFNDAQRFGTKVLADLVNKPKPLNLVLLPYLLLVLPANVFSKIYRIQISPEMPVPTN